MKIKGRELKGPNVEILVIPRSEGDVVFKAQAIMDFEPFKKMCPEPKPPTGRTPKGKVTNLEDPRYKAEQEDYAQKRLDWTIIESLRPSEIEWEQVQYNNPDTWKLYKQELEESGFNIVEVGRIVGLVLNANCLNEDRLREAQERFLAEQEETRNGQLFLHSEPNIMPHGKPVSASA